MTTGREQRAADSKTSVAKLLTQTIRFVFNCLLLAFFLPTDVSVEAQQSKDVRIGYVTGGGEPSTSSPNFAAFRHAMQNLGYIDGKNIVIDYRHAEWKDDNIPSVVAELVQRNIDVLVSPTFRVVREAKRATRTIPIVMAITEDPVRTGLVDSLARPGGNITGLTRLTRDLSEKRLELLKEVVPGISRVGLLWEADTASPVENYQNAANALKIALESLEVRGASSNLKDTFQTVAKRRANAIIAVRTSLLVNYRAQIADLAIKHRLPLMSAGADFVESGGLVSYAANDAESFRRAAVYVDKILKGTKPANLPIEQPTKFELVINLKTAKQIGLIVPPNVLARADKVIK